MNEWGVPDWRDAAAYGPRPDWNVNRWRWEFIRRRQDVRDRFDKFAWEAYQDDLASFEERPEGFPDGRVRRPDECGFYFHTRSIFNGRMTPHPLGNPRIGDQPHFVIAWQDGARALTLGGEETKTESYFRIDFDMTRALAPQLEMAKDWLTSIQAERVGKKIQVRQHPEKWPGYLRVLDARADGASWSMVANILPPTVSPTVDTARSVHKQAEALCFNAWD